MKGEFNHFDAATTRSRVMTDPVVHVAKSGLIVFNKLAVEKLKLRAGEGIKFHQEVGRPRMWYIEKVKENGIVLKKYKDSLSLSCSAVAKAMIHSLNLSKGFACRIGSEPDEDGWWSLITSAVSK